MPGLNVHVTLSEALEVRGGPLLEDEIWGVLCQGAEALQDLFLTGELSGEEGLNFAITPDTLMLCANGRVTFTASSFETVPNRNVVPPEFFPGSHPSDSVLEKMLVFALGMTMYEAADFKLPQQQELALSGALDALLSIMCEENPTQRSALAHVLESCGHHSRTDPYFLPNSHHVTRLYKLVLGSELMLDSWSRGGDAFERSHRTRRKRSPQCSRNSSIHRSRSRSRSRSCSRTREDGIYRSRHLERPLPVGRDQPVDYQDGHVSRRQQSFSSHRSGRSRHIDRHDSQGPSHSGSRQSLTTHLYDSYMTIPKQMPNRRVLTELQPRVGYAHDVHIIEDGHRAKPADIGKSIQMTYNRLRERRRKLQALRYGLEFDEMEYSDAGSLHSEVTDFTDRKSLMSGNSYTHGIYRPDLLSQYGSQVALQMGQRRAEDVESVLSTDIDLLRRQQLEIQAAKLSGSGGQPQGKGKQQYRSMSADGRPLTSSQAKGAIHQARPPSQPPPPPRSRSIPRSTSPRRIREYFGAEFVELSSRPPISLIIPQARHVNPSHLRQLTIVHLTGQRLTISCDPSNTGRQLFDTIVSHLALPEHFFFGITYVKDVEHYFIEDTQKLHKIAPPGWREPGKGRIPASFTMFFRIKYYVDSIATLRHPLSRHLYYLQLRRDVLEERCHVTEDQALTLAGIALQAEYDDYDPNTHSRAYFQPDNYIPQRIMRHVGSAYVRENVPSLHREHSGLGQEAAEWKYMKELQNVAEYGIHFYKVFRSKKDTAVPLWIGVGIHGVLVAEQRGDHREPQHRHPWHFTQKISFNRRRFSITPKTNVGPLKLTKLNYFTDSHRKGRYLLQFCTAQHHFQMRMKTRVNITDMFDEEYPIEAGGNSGRFEPADFDPEFDQGGPDINYPFSDGSFEEYSDDDQQMEEPPYENVKQRGSSQPAPRSRAGQVVGVPGEGNEEHYHEDEQAFVLGASIRSHDATLYPTEDETLSESLASRFNHLPDSPERCIAIVELEKEPLHGIGMTIVGGENTGKLDLGVFVRSVDQEGPAARSGRVHPGDRIIAINGQSLEGMPHHVAVELIRNSPSHVQLVLSQNKMAAPQQAYDQESSPSIDERDVNGMMAAQTMRADQGSSSNDDDLMRRKIDGQEMTQDDSAMLTIGPFDDGLSDNSSDLELEDVVPPEALKPDYPRHHMSYSPSRPSGGAQGSRTGTPGMADGRPSSGSVGMDGRHALPTRQATTEGSDGYISDVELDEALKAGMRHQSAKTLPLSTVLPETAPTGSQLSSKRSQSAPHAHLKLGDKYEVVLEKIEGSLGLNVTGGINTSVKYGGIYVKSLNEKGAAEGDGRTQIGDRVLEVNGFSLVGVTHKQAVETLRKAPQVCKLVMERWAPPVSRLDCSATTPSLGSDSGNSQMDRANSADIELQVPNVQPPVVMRGMEYYPFVTEEDTFMVHLSKDGTSDCEDWSEWELEQSENDEGTLRVVQFTKDSSGLGFSIIGGSKVHPDPLHCITRVKKVFPVGAAAQSGQVQDGDVILEVNDKPTKGLSPKETVTLLRTAPPDVKLLICRPPEGTLPLIAQLLHEVDSPYDSSLRETPMSQISSSPATPGIGERGGDPDGASPANTARLPQPSNSVTSANEKLADTGTPYNTYSQSAVKPSDEIVTPSTAHSTDSDYSGDNESDIGYSASMVQPHPNVYTQNAVEVEEQQSPAVSGHGDADNSEDATPVATPRGRASQSTPSPVRNFDKVATLRPDNSATATLPGDACGKNLHCMTPTDSLYGDADATDEGPEEDKDVEEQRKEAEGQHEEDEEDTFEPGEFEVTMTKGDKGLGFTVAGGQRTGYFYVKSILYNPAVSDGRIHEGDRLIKVDGQDMTELNHKEAVNHLRLTPNTVTIRFYRPVRVMTPTEDPKHKVVIKNNSSEPEGSDKMSRENSQAAPSGVPPENVCPSVRNMVHALEVNQTLIRPHTYGRKQDESEDEDELEEIEERHRRGMFSSTHGLEEMTPTVTTGDQTPSQGLEESTEKPRGAVAPGVETDERSDDLMSQASSWGNLTLPMPEDDHNEEVRQITGAVDTPTPQEPGVMRVKLTKSLDENYGFSLVQGEKGSASALYIRSVTPAGVAASDGHIHIGDRLLQVNRQSVIGMPHNKAVALIKKSSEHMTITLARPPSRPTSEMSRGSHATPTGSPKAVPGTDSWSRTLSRQSAGTDSDIDSTAFDDEGNVVLSSSQHRNQDTLWSGHTTPTGHLEDDDHDPDTFDSVAGREAYSGFISHSTPPRMLGSGAESGEDDDNQNHRKHNSPPEKPPRKGISRHPSELSDTWLETLTLVNVSKESVHYSGRQLIASVKQLTAKVEQDDPIEEYKTLRHAKLTDNCNDARRPENKNKNRYRNVLPYDSTRVHLSGDDSYINASHIRYMVGKDWRHYIASQGPLPQTTDDFWRMIWEQKADTIAMVTLDMEGGKVKCHRYWPDSVSTPLTVCDRFEVSLLQAHTLKNFDVHHIKMEDLETGMTHCVTHVNFTTWPDHGSPDTALPLLQYTRFLHLVHNTGPVVVHCSAGIGRTGALITVDIVLAMVEKDLKFDIQKIVTDLRRQRQGMIQTKDQYVFCYKAIVEALGSVLLESG